MRESVRKAEGIARAAIEFDEPFQGFEASRQAGAQIGEKATDDLVLTGISHGKMDFLEKGKGLLALIRLEQSFRNFLRRAKVFDVSLEHPQRQSGRLFPIRVFEINVEEEFCLFAALVEIGDLFEGLGSLVEIALGRMDTRFYDYSGGIF